jgi:hypothetical protein
VVRCPTRRGWSLSPEPRRSVSMRRRGWPPDRPGTGTAGSGSLGSGSPRLRANATRPPLPDVPFARCFTKPISYPLHHGTLSQRPLRCRPSKRRAACDVETRPDPGLPRLRPPPLAGRAACRPEPRLRPPRFLGLDSHATSGAEPDASSSEASPPPLQTSYLSSGSSTGPH